MWAQSSLGGASAGASSSGGGGGSNNNYRVRGESGAVAALLSPEEVEADAQAEVACALRQPSTSFSTSVFDAELRPLFWAPRRRQSVNPLKPALSPVEFAALIATIAMLVKNSAALHRTFVAHDGCVWRGVGVTCE